MLNNNDRNILFRIYIFKFVKTIIEYFHKSLKTSLEIVSNILDSAIAKLFFEKIKFKTQKRMLLIQSFQRGTCYIFIRKKKKKLLYSNNVSKKISFFSINKEKKNLQNGNNL